MAVRKAEVIYVGDAASLVKAAQQSAAANQEAADKIVSSFERVSKAAVAAGQVAAKASASSGASMERQATAAGEAAKKQAAAVNASAKEQEAAYARAADAARAAAIKQEAAAGLGVKGVADKASSIGKTLSTYVTLPVAAAAYAGVKLAANFQTAMTTIHTQAGASTGEVKSMSKAVLELAPHTQQGPVKLAEALYQLESVGVRGTTALEDLKAASHGAAMGNADLEETTSALAAATTAYNTKGSEANKVMAILDATVGVGKMRMGELVESFHSGILPVAEAAGVSLHSLGAGLAVMTDRGVPATRAMTYLRQAIFYLANESTGPAKKALAEVGLSAAQLTKALGEPDGLNHVVEILHERLGNLGKGERLEVLKDLGGGSRSATGLVAMYEALSNQTSNVAGKYQKIEEIQKSFGARVAAQEKTLAAELKKAWSSVQVGLIQFGNTVGPILAKAAQAVAFVAQKFAALPAPIRSVIAVAALFAAALGPVLVAFGAISRAILSSQELLASLQAKWTQTTATIESDSAAMEASMTGLSAASTADMDEIAAKATAMGSTVTAADTEMVAANESAGASFATFAGGAIGWLSKLGLAFVAAEGAAHAFGAVINALGGEAPTSLSQILGGGQPGEAGIAAADKAAGGKQSANFAKEMNSGRAAYVRGIEKRYHLPHGILWGVYGNETSYGANITTSSTGAMGAFQFEPGTAQEYGYPMTNTPSSQQFYQQAAAAASYLSKLIAQYHGNVSEALEAYSGHTPGYAQAALEKAQGAPSGPSALVPPGKKKKAALAALGVPAGVLAMLQTAEALQGAPYTFGGGHESLDEPIARLKQIGIDCSGFVSRTLSAGGVRLPSPQTTEGLPQYLAPGGGRYVTVYDRANAGSNSHVIEQILGKFFESGGRGGKGAHMMTKQEAAEELAGGGFKEYHPANLNSPVRGGLSSAAILQGSGANTSALISGQVAKELAKAKKAYEETIRAEVANEKALIKFTDEAKKRLAAFNDAIRTVGKELTSLAKQAAAAWKTAAKEVIDVRHEHELEGIEEGPQAKALEKLKERREEIEDKREESKLKKNLKTAKESGDKEAIEEAHNAISDYETKEQEKSLEKAIASAKKAADEKQKDATNQLGRETGEYEDNLNRQFTALTAQLKKRELTYQAFAERVNKMLSAAELTINPSESTTGAITGYGGLPFPSGSPIVISQKSQPHASGGFAWPGGSYLVGETGPERFTPSSPGYVTSASQSRGAGGPLIHVEEMNISDAHDAERAANKLAFKLIHGGSTLHA